MLVKYLRDANRRPFGTIVALGPGKIGVSLCSPRDNFSKFLGIRIASGRAESQYQTPSFPNRTIDGDIITDVVDQEYAEMYDRAERYFGQISGKSQDFQLTKTKSGV